ncbi:MAG: anthranilate synthase component I [Clostridiales Family XIII bacterium]|nr:anthranilate synthase component I [Clostridiales Family XIII bacterium]
MNILTLEDAKKYARDFPSIPVVKVLNGGWLGSMEVFLILKKLSRQCFILESLEDAENRGRYTFIGYDPKLEISCLNGTLTVKGAMLSEIKTNDPGKYINQIIDENRSPLIEGLPPFTGGLVGYFAYDYIKYNEPELNLDADDQEGFRDVDLMLFDRVVVFDHLERKLFLIANVRTDQLEENFHKGEIELDNLANTIRNGEQKILDPITITSPFRELFDKEGYCEMVRKAKHYIHEGDIFQVVLSNRLEADAEGSLFDTYGLLRRMNPSPYMFYFSSDDVEIAGASPETLVKTQGERVYTFPLAGTRPRGMTAQEDQQNEEELLHDEKELAEHNMLVDLGRNDIGKISKFGTVKVENYMSIERYSHVMHIASTVSGEIRDDVKATDAVNAVLPAGTLSGAPKIRACEIINELENNKRGIYGGAIGYISFTGEVDTCIAIRLAIKKNGKVFIRSGAGIVLDSVPENEYKECRNKMQAVMDALLYAEYDGKRRMK